MKVTSFSRWSNDGGVVDQDVDAAEALESGLRGLFNSGEIVDIDNEAVDDVDDTFPLIPYLLVREYESLSC